MAMNESSVQPGPRNTIADVAGIRVGQAADRKLRSGVSVVISDAPAVAAVDVRGGGPGTRETDALAAGNLVETVDALVFSGGSAYGLDAASGVHSWLAGKGRGFKGIEGAKPVPIVPAAILYDLNNGGDKDWGSTPPYRDLAMMACENAGYQVVCGKQGAGYGAVAGDLEGGTGSASAVDSKTGITIGALAAVNSSGRTTFPDGTFYAWPYEFEEEFGGKMPTMRLPTLGPAFPKQLEPGTNTTLVAIATDAKLSRQDLIRICVMAQDGMARAIRPVHSPFDGDAVFGLATGEGAEVTEPFWLARLGAIAADTVARAIARGVFAAESVGDKLPSWQDKFGR